MCSSHAHHKPVLPQVREWGPWWSNWAQPPDGWFQQFCIGVPPGGRLLQLGDKAPPGGWLGLMCCRNATGGSFGNLMEHPLVANFGIFIQEHPLTLKLGIIFGKIPLVVNSSTWLGLGAPSDGRFWQLSKGLPTWGHLGHHILEEPPCWLISATLEGSTPGGPCWQLDPGLLPGGHFEQLSKDPPGDNFYAHLSVECPWHALQFVQLYLDRELVPKVPLLPLIWQRFCRQILPI